MLATFGDGDIFLFILEFFMFVIWFWLLITVFGDLFRDHESSGGVKAFWVIFVVLVPYLGVFIYLIARGGGMAARAAKSQQEAKAQFDQYVRSVSTDQTPTDQIASAKSLLDSGAIDQAEFDRLKAKALS